jgi:predicted transposase YbfD/YdcC
MDALPIACVAIDGKTVLCRSKEISRFAQKAVHHDGNITYNLRVLRAVLTSSVYKPCIDQMPVMPETNEQGAFHEFFDDLVRREKRKDGFELFTMDSGFCYLPVANRMDDAGYAYLMALKKGQPELFKEAERVLLSKMKKEAPEAVTDWEIHGSDRVKRALWRTSDMAGYPTTTGVWNHLRQVWVVRTTRRKASGKEETSLRYFVTNLLWNRLNADECLSVVRSHWGVEDDCFWSLDREWQEDLRAWCLKEEAVLCQSYLRIMAYNICQILRRRRGRDRKNGKREWPSWNTIFHWIEKALISPIAEWALRIEGLIST